MLLLHTSTLLLTTPAAAWHPDPHADLSPRGPEPSKVTLGV